MHQSPSGLVELTNHKEARQEVTVIGPQVLHENNPFSGAVRPSASAFYPHPMSIT